MNTKYMKYVAVLLISIPTITLASIDFNLKYGQKTPEVRELQDFLIDKGVLQDGNNTGYFGTKTLKAVKQYQLDNKIPSTGYVGSMTRKSINTELEEITASSTEAEIKETGTSTPIVIIQPQIIYRDVVREVIKEVPLTTKTTIMNPIEPEVIIANVYIDPVCIDKEECTLIVDLAKYPIFKEITVVTNNGINETWDNHHLDMNHNELHLVFKKDGKSEYTYSVAGFKIDGTKVTSNGTI
jgi:Putative peptidoglycan binding domain